LAFLLHGHSLITRASQTGAILVNNRSHFLPPQTIRCG
jgi:hypothetical protein